MEGSEVFFEVVGVYRCCNGSDVVGGAAPILASTQHNTIQCNNYGVNSKE